MVAPTWRWLYTHTVEDDPALAKARAAHIYEEPFLWGTSTSSGSASRPPRTRRLSARMTDYWTNFARMGDPNGPGLPPWPRYETATEPTLVLDTDMTVEHRYHADQCAVLDVVPSLYP